MGKEVLSRIAPTEWCNYDEYRGKYLYDYDFTFRRQLEEHEKAQQREEKVLLLPHVQSGKPNAWGGLQREGSRVRQARPRFVREALASDAAGADGTTAGGAGRQQGGDKGCC